MKLVYTWSVILQIGIDLRSNIGLEVGVSGVWITPANLSKNLLEYLVVRFISKNRNFRNCRYNETSYFQPNTIFQYPDLILAVSDPAPRPRPTVNVWLELSS